MAKPEWGTRRKCLECEASFYDFKKENPVCPKCGTEFKPKEIVIEEPEEEEDIPQNEDEILVDDLETMEEDDPSELDVEEDMQNIDPNLVNDDDIDNVFVEDSMDLEEDLNNSMGTLEDENF